MNFSRVIFDIETNGLLPEHVEPPFCMDRIHCIVIKCIDTGEVKEFVNNDKLYNLLDGVRILEKAKLIVGHNILGFDIPAVELIFPDFKTDAKFVDTLVMSRMLFADQKTKDFRLAAKGELSGGLIGRHALEAWGQRLGLHKGDYTKDRKAMLTEKHKILGLEKPTPEEFHEAVWGHWNQEMQEYCVNDVAVNYLLWIRIEAMNWSDYSTTFEHRIHLLMLQQQTNGFLLDIEGAKRLRDELNVEYYKLSEEATAQIGTWFRPKKILTDKPQYEFGDTDKRRTWGEAVIPKRTMQFANANAKVIASGDYAKIRANKVIGCAYVPVIHKEFNPNSRTQIIDRLKTIYGWEPQDFTEKGNPEVNDEVLRNLAEHIPLAETLAECFYMKKRVSQVSDGKNGWLKLVRPDGRIHGRVNVGGTVTGRATHSAPNISQVPSVRPIETKDYEEGLRIIERHKAAGTYVTSKWKKKGEWEIQVRGREGQHGWDCRELFIVPEGYTLVGCDLSGIEARCLGNLTFPFDDGELAHVILDGDIHAKNAELAGITRGIAKTLLYAFMYGAGMAKLGSIVEPLSPEPRQITLGKQLHKKLLDAMPSLKEAIKAIKKEKRRNSGTILGLDGRRLYVRSDHSALNTRLQSDGAIISKMWALLIDDAFYDEGWDHHIEGDYAFCSYSHDELQIAVKDEFAEKAGQIMQDQAPIAGEFFGFHVPVTAEYKLGTNWAWTH